jgi:hypothetical protein
MKQLRHPNVVLLKHCFHAEGEKVRESWPIPSPAPWHAHGGPGPPATPARESRRRLGSPPTAG